MKPKSGKLASIPLSDYNVELVGGPLCGLKIQWNKGEKDRYIEYHSGMAVYRYDGPSETAEDGRITAIYIGG